MVFPKPVRVAGFVLLHCASLGLPIGMKMLALIDVISRKIRFFVRELPGYAQGI